MKSTRRWEQLLLNSLAIILGNALYSLVVALFLEPAGLITGGATGIALAFGRLTGLSVSGFLFLFNMSMLVWGWAVLGKKFALNTLASSVLSPAFLALFERLLDGRVLTEDIFLCTIFSGLGIGVALGMVIRAGASTGGMDIPPLVLQKWFRWPVSITMMLFDIAILLVQAAFSQPEQEGGRHGAGSNAARVKGDGGVELGHHEGDADGKGVARDEEPQDGDAGEHPQHGKTHREGNACREGCAHGAGGDGTVGHFLDLLVQHIDGGLGLDDEVADEHPDGHQQPAEALACQHLTQIITGGHKADVCACE